MAKEKLPPKIRFEIGKTEFPSYAEAFEAANNAIDHGEEDLTFEEVKKRGDKFAYKVIRVADAKPIEDTRPIVVPDREGDHED